MKTLRSISTAVLFCLVLAVPATALAAEPPTIKVSVSSEQISKGGITPVDYTVAGTDPENASTRTGTFRVVLNHATEEKFTNCKDLAEEPESDVTPLYNESLPQGHTAFEHSELIPAKLYEAKGAYFVCAFIENRNNEGSAYVTAHFLVTKSHEEVRSEEAKEHEVQEPPKEVKAKEAPKEETVTPTPPTTVPISSQGPTGAPSETFISPSGTLAITTAVIKPLTAAQKLHAALAKCKKLKKHSKRVKCERTAKKAARR